MLDARPGDGAPGGVAFSPEFVHRLTQEESSAMTEYKCPDCGYIYDEAKGNPHEGFAPNTTWAQIPDDWACPDCAVRDKVDFIPLLAQGASATAIEASTDAEPFAKWHCVTCGHIYDEAVGDPATGLPPGTRWSDVPADWYCPDCGATKEDYERLDF
ncbi:rubredoxin [Sphingopyxis granuli]|jgi:rubredoxin|uniref:rubredoxin n=1 Tax=Sphingopyxis granuli TaxID=267128 RepID=UPI003F76B785